MVAWYPQLTKGREHITRWKIWRARLAAWYWAARLSYRQSVDEIRHGSTRLAEGIMATIAIAISLYIGWPLRRYEPDSSLYRVLTYDVSWRFWAWVFFVTGALGILSCLFARNWVRRFWICAQQAAVWGWVAMILYLAGTPGGFAATCSVLCVAQFVIMGLLRRGEGERGENERGDREGW